MGIKTANRNAGKVPVDAGMVLAVDPSNLPVDVLRAITQPNAYGVTLAVVALTRDEDGWYDPFAGPDWHVLPADEVKDIADGWADQ